MILDCILIENAAIKVTFITAFVEYLKVYLETFKTSFIICSN